MYCSQCGAANESTDRFCAQCGAPLTKQENSEIRDLGTAQYDQPANNKTKKILIAIVVLLLLGAAGYGLLTLGGFNQTNEAIKVYFDASSFEKITFKMIPPQGASGSGTSANTRFTPYVNSLTNLDGELEGFYGFLLEKGFMTFKENSVPFYRRNVSGTPFASEIHATHEYSGDIDKYLIRNADGHIDCQIAKREIKDITYKKTYEQDFLGKKLSVTAFTFNYAIVNNLAGLPKIDRLFEGNVKMAKNPDDGKWNILEEVLTDKGASEIVSLLPQGKLKQYITKRSAELNTAFAEKRTADLSKNSKVFTYIVGPEATFLGIVTADDAIKIEPVKGQYSKVELIFNGASNQRPNDMIGKRFYALGHGGQITSWNTSSMVYQDMLYYGYLEPYGMKEVNRYEVVANLVGSSDMQAKITVYCIENSDSVNFEYWYGQKPFPSCGERLKSVDNTGFPIYKYLGQKELPSQTQKKLWFQR